MQKFFDNVADPQGNVIPRAVVTVKDAASGSPSTIYSDNIGTTKTNPITCDSNGYFEFYAANGRYTLTVTGGALTTRVVQDVLLEDITGTGASLVGFSHSDTNPAGSIGAKAHQVISVKDAPYSAVGDGVTDDTASIQAAMNAALSINGGSLFFPSGTYKITSALTIGLWTGWRMFGASRGDTVIKQATDNTPCFKFVKENAWGWAITDFQFTWVNAQPASNTSAVAILVQTDTNTSAGVYNAVVDRVSWNNGYRGFAVNESATNLAWGITFDNINHQGAMTGAAISLVPSPVAGQPNIRIGHIYARADAATETLIRIKAVTGFTIENYEVNQNTNGVGIFQCTGGCSGFIEAIRVEAATYTASRNIIDMQDSQVNIGTVTQATMTVNGAGINVALLNQSGGVGNCNVGAILSSGVTITTGSYYTFGGTSARRFALGSIAGISGFTALTNINASSTADGLIVYDWDMRRVSANNGDADKTLVMGNETIQMFETTLTADRTVTLPAHVTTSNAYNGAWFRIVRNNVTPGAFQILVKNAAGATIKAIPISTNAFVDVAYRRLNWVLVGYGTL